MPEEWITIEGFEATLHGFRLPIGLRLTSLKLSGANLDVKVGELQTRMAEPAPLEVVVSEQDIATFLESKAPGGLRNFGVRAESGELLATATMNMVLPIQAEVRCRLEIVEGGKKLYVRLESAKALGVGANQLVQSQFDKINPILDTADLPIPATLQDVSIGGGMVTVRGSAQPPGLTP